MGKAYPYIGAGLALLVPVLSSPEIAGWEISLIQAFFVAAGFYGQRVLEA